MSRLRLPRCDLLVRTNDEDPLPFYYHPLTGWVYRRRLELALAALPERPLGAILEIGYGSGVLLPALASRCRELHAIDLHERANDVTRMLDQEGVRADLRAGSILDLPYAGGRFDAVVCLSVLEHMDERTLPAALAEARRVLGEEGVAVLGFPVRNLATDVFYRLVGYSPREIHPSSHRDIAAALPTVFGEALLTSWPRGIPVDLALYVIARCRRVAS